MFNSKLVAPVLIFFAGAVLGRLMGLKPLVRGAMTIASMGGLEPRTMNAHAPTRKLAHRPSRRRATHRRSRAA
jgi:hypothetical protein